MIIRFLYNFDDFDALKRKRLFPGWRPRLLAVGLAAAQLAGLLISCAGGIVLAIYVHAAWTLAAILPLVFILLVAARLWRQIAGNTVGTPQQWASNPLSHQPTTVEVTADGFCQENNYLRIFMQWHAIDSIVESEHGIAFLFVGKYYLVPKRVFDSPHELREFTTLLISHYGRPIVSAA